MAEDVIAVKYAFVDGAHVFTSKEEVGLGLFAAHRDLKTAFDETAVQLKTLLKLNHQIDANVESMVPYEEFEAFTKSLSGTGNPHIRHRIASEIDWHKSKAA